MNIVKAAVICAVHGDTCDQSCPAWDCSLECFSLAVVNYDTAELAEEIALMEHVAAAAADLDEQMTKGTARGGKPHDAFTALQCCSKRLAEFRKGRSL